MKKVLEHNGKSFSMDLKLNHSSERRMDGKREHLLSSYGLEKDNKWNKSWMIDSSKMEEQIAAAEQEIKEYAEGKKLTEEETIADKLGFK